MLHVRKRKIHLHRNLLHKTSDIPAPSASPDPPPRSRKKIPGPRSVRGRANAPVPQPPLCGSHSTRADILCRTLSLPDTAGGVHGSVKMLAGLCLADAPEPLKRGG